MNENELDKILSGKDNFLIEEKLFNHYMAMRKCLKEFESFKYDYDDEMLKSKDFKNGFYSAVKLLSSIIMDVWCYVQEEVWISEIFS